MDISEESARSDGPNVREDIPGRFNEIQLISHHWPRVLAAYDGVILPPYEVLIHPSSTCNLRCAWCIGEHVPIQSGLRMLDASKFHRSRLPDRLADTSNMMKLAHDLIEYKRSAPAYAQDSNQNKPFGVENVSFSGLIGEPLTAKEAVLEAMDFLASQGLRVGLFTNGLLMDDDVIDVILRISYVHLSIDAGTPNTYAQLKCGGQDRGEQLFALLVNNISKLISRRRSSGSKLEVSASFILYPENYCEVYDTAKFLRDLGVDIFRIKQDNSGRRLLTDKSITKAQELLERIKVELEDDHFRLVVIHRLEDSNEFARSFSKCLVTELMAAVGSDGNLYPCNYHPRPGGLSYGSVIDGKFKDVWEGSVRSSLKMGIPKVCPAVCDPFKNRANRLLDSIGRLRATSQRESFENMRTNLILRAPSDT